MGKVATIILNRNLPEVTDRLVEHIEKYDGDVTDIFVVEAGSDKEKLSRHTTWHADWPEAMEQGLRYPRGMNYGLCKIMQEGKFENYNAFFLLTNDTEFKHEPVVTPLLEEFALHPRVGILSPCARNWGERIILKEQQTKYFWYIHNSAFLLRKEFVESIMENENPDHMNFLLDGTNFRGFGTESELIAKGYANDWASAITTKVWAEENESYLLKQSDLIKTENYEENLRLYIEEGRRWMRRKYGFNSRWSMQMYAKFFYDQFFQFHPEYESYKL